MRICVRPPAVKMSSRRAPCARVCRSVLNGRPVVYCGNDTGIPRVERVAAATRMRGDMDGGIEAGPKPIAAVSLLAFAGAWMILAAIFGPLTPSMDVRRSGCDTRVDGCAHVRQSQLQAVVGRRGTAGVGGGGDTGKRWTRTRPRGRRCRRGRTGVARSTLARVTFPRVSLPGEGLVLHGPPLVA